MGTQEPKLNNVAIVIPVLNEAKSIIENLDVISACVNKICGTVFSLIVVDDGSSDNTVLLLRQYAQEHERVSLLCLNRHFGKESAIIAGLHASRYFDATIVMDSDLQHPPTLIANMINLWAQGSKVVEAVKRSRGKESVSKGVLARIYYFVFNYLTRLNISNHTDFKLLDRDVVETYCALPEHRFFFRGLVQWMNFPSQEIGFSVAESTRPASVWRFGTLVSYAVTSITSFTAFPLQIVTGLGALTFVLSLIVGSMALADKFADRAVDGFTTVILLILLIGSILMFSIGLIGIYIGHIYDEVKGRPKYLINKQQSIFSDATNTQREQNEI